MIMRNTVPALFLCLILSSSVIEARVLRSRHLQQQTGHLTKVQQSILRLLEYLASVSPRYRQYLDAFLSRLGITGHHDTPTASSSTVSVAKPTTLGAQPVATTTTTTNVPVTTEEVEIEEQTTVPNSLVESTTTSVTTTTEEVEAEESTSPASSMTSGALQTTTEEVEAEEVTQPGPAMTTTEEVEEEEMTTPSSGTVQTTTEEVEEEEMTTPASGTVQTTTEEVEEEEMTTAASGTVLTTTEEMESEEMAQAGSAMTTTEEPPEEEEEEPIEIILPLRQRWQCTQMEGICLRQCENPADVIPGISCGRDVMGNALVCCDD